MFDHIRGWFRSAYDATESRNRRRSRYVTTRDEDKALKPYPRRVLISNARDLFRNYPIARWAIEKRVDHVTTMSFNPSTGIPELDERLEDLVEWWSRPGNFEATSRFSRQSCMRLVEQSALLDGDLFVLKLDDGRIQCIEGDRVTNPTEGFPQGFVQTEWTHGVRTSPNGSHRDYCLCDRGLGINQYIYKTTIPAQFAHHYGYLHRFDQIRGISPIASALNAFQDIYECSEYALARMKVGQLFALKFTRQSDEALDADGGENSTTDRTIDFTSGPSVLDLDPGDDADFLESHQPSTEFAQFMELMIQSALKSIDIPYSFYNESFTNYSGARSALLLYKQSVAVRQADLKRLLDMLLIWRLGLWIADGDLVLPQGMAVRDLKWDWIPRGIGHIDIQKESNAEIALVTNKLASRQQICKSHGQDWLDTVQQLAYEDRVLAELAQPAAQISEPIDDGDEDDDNDPSD